MIAYMIVGPYDLPDEGKMDMGLSTIGKNAGEAWFKHTRHDPSKIQAWFDKGYRVRRIEITMLKD